MNKTRLIYVLLTVFFILPYDVACILFIHMITSTVELNGFTLHRQ